MTWERDIFTRKTCLGKRLPTRISRTPLCASQSLATTGSTSASASTSQQLFAGAQQQNLGAVAHGTATSLPTSSHQSGVWFPCRSLQVFDEPVNSFDSMESTVQRHVEQFSKSSGVGISAGDGYESTSKSERALARFQHRLQREPGQCLRYAYGGKPLWPSNMPIPEVPRCACGQIRTFELQLMPALLSVVDTDRADFLEPNAETKGKDDPGAPALLTTGGMDWMTVLVYSCPDSCDQSNEEFAIIHPPL